MDEDIVNMVAESFTGDADFSAPEYGRWTDPDRVPPDVRSGVLGLESEGFDVGEITQLSHDDGNVYVFNFTPPAIADDRFNIRSISSGVEASARGRVPDMTFRLPTAIPWRFEGGGKEARNTTQKAMQRAAMALGVDVDNTRIRTDRVGSGDGLTPHLIIYDPQGGPPVQAVLAAVPDALDAYYETFERAGYDIDRSPGDDSAPNPFAAPNDFSHRERDEDGDPIRFEVPDVSDAISISYDTQSRRGGSAWGVVTEVAYRDGRVEVAVDTADPRGEPDTRLVYPTAPDEQTLGSGTYRRTDSGDESDLTSVRRVVPAPLVLRPPVEAGDRVKLGTGSTAYRVESVDRGRILLEDDRRLPVTQVSAFDEDVDDYDPFELFPGGADSLNLEAPASLNALDPNNPDYDGVKREAGTLIADLVVLFQHITYKQFQETGVEGAREEDFPEAVRNTNDGIITHLGKDLLERFNEWVKLSPKWQKGGADLVPNSTAGSGGETPAGTVFFSGGDIDAVLTGGITVGVGADRRDRRRVVTAIDGIRDTIHRRGIQRNNYVLHRYIATDGPASEAWERAGMEEYSPAMQDALDDFDIDRAQALGEVTGDAALRKLMRLSGLPSNLPDRRRVGEFAPPAEMLPPDVDLSAPKPGAGVWYRIVTTQGHDFEPWEVDAVQNVITEALEVDESDVFPVTERNVGKFYAQMRDFRGGGLSDSMLEADQHKLSRWFADAEGAAFDRLEIVPQREVYDAVPELQVGGIGPDDLALDAPTQDSEADAVAQQAVRAAERKGASSGRVTEAGLGRRVIEFHLPDNPPETLARPMATGIVVEPDGSLHAADIRFPQAPPNQFDMETVDAAAEAAMAEVNLGDVGFVRFNQVVENEHAAHIDISRRQDLSHLTPVRLAEKAVEAGYVFNEELTGSVGGKSRGGGFAAPDADVMDTIADGISDLRYEVANRMGSEAGETLDFIVPSVNPSTATRDFQSSVNVANGKIKSFTLRFPMVLKEHYGLRDLHSISNTWDDMPFIERGTRMDRVRRTKHPAGWTYHVEIFYRDEGIEPPSPEQFVEMVEESVEIFRARVREYEAFATDLRDPDDLPGLSAPGEPEWLAAPGEGDVPAFLHQYADRVESWPGVADAKWVSTSTNSILDWRFDWPDATVAEREQRRLDDVARSAVIFRDGEVDEWQLRLPPIPQGVNEDSFEVRDALRSLFERRIGLGREVSVLLADDGTTWTPHVRTRYPKRDPETAFDAISDIWSAYREAAEGGTPGRIEKGLSAPEMAAPGGPERLSTPRGQGPAMRNAQNLVEGLRDVGVTAIDGVQDEGSQVMVEWTPRDQDAHYPSVVTFDPTTGNIGEVTIRFGPLGDREKTSAGRKRDIDADWADLVLDAGRAAGVMEGFNMGMPNYDLGDAYIAPELRPHFRARNGPYPDVSVRDFVDFYRRLDELFLERFGTLEDRFTDPDFQMQAPEMAAPRMVDTMAERLREVGMENVEPLEGFDAIDFQLPMTAGRMEMSTAELTEAGKVGGGLVRGPRMPPIPPAEEETVRRDIERAILDAAPLNAEAGQRGADISIRIEGGPDTGLRPHADIYGPFSREEFVGFVKAMNQAFIDLEVPR